MNDAGAAQMNAAVSAYHTIDRLATKLEEMGYLSPNASYEEFEIIVNQFITRFQNDLHTM